MAVVLEAMPFSAAWRKRQNRVQAIQRLDGALLVYAEDSGMRRWFEVQADDVRGPPAVLGPAVTRIQAAQALLLKAFLPKTNVTIRATEPLTYFTVRVTRSQHENDLCSPY